MKVTFKEVDQGDSIILEWHNVGELHIGIIDANLKNNKTNPTLNYIKSHGIKHIDFILLTHPHLDHFSGLNSILDYCELAKITIGYFLHTCTNRDYYLAAVAGIVIKRQIQALFKKAYDLNKIGLIEIYSVVNNLTRQIPLAEGWMLSFLKPSQSEIDQYNIKAYKGSTYNDISINNSDANLLCTLLLIENKDSAVLLTSDLSIDCFKEIHRKGYQNCRNKFKLIQIPHHGSELNHYPTFWKFLKKDNG